MTGDAQRGRPAWGRPALTGRAPLLVAGAALLLLVWPFGTGLGVAVLTVLVVATLVADVVLAPRPATVGVGRRLPAVVGLGAAATLSWTVHNPCNRPLVVRIADELAPSLGASARRARVRVPAGRSVTLRVALAPTRRGRFVPGELVVRAEGPLGLMARQAQRYLPGELRVYPSFGSRRQADLRIERARILEVGLRSARTPGGAAPSLTSYASTGSTTTAGVSTGPRRPGATAP